MKCFNVRSSQLMFYLCLFLAILPYFIVDLWLNAHALCVQAQWAWGGGDSQWRGWTWCQTLTRPSSPSPRTPSGTSWRMVTSSPQGSRYSSSITRAGTPDLYSAWFSCATITPSTSHVARLVCDRGTEPGQGARRPVHTRPHPSHPGPPEELWGEETNQVGGLFWATGIKGRQLVALCQVQS